MHYGTALVDRLVVSHRPIGGNREITTKQRTTLLEKPKIRSVGPNGPCSIS